MANKILVAYFSCGGETAAVAKTIARASGGELFEIKPVVPYTAADLDWRDKNSRSSVEMRTLERPEIADKVENFGSYDAIFIGFPIWWYIAPTIINGFLASYDFSGKKVIPFATSGSSEIAKAEAVLKPICSPETVWLPGKRIDPACTTDDMREWVKELGLDG